MLFLEVPQDIKWRVVSADSAVDDPSAVLSPDELARMESFGHADRRRGFAFGRIAARSLLAERLDVAPVDVPLAVASDDGLFVEGHPIHVSISHAGHAAHGQSIAVIADRPIGVDLEEIVPRRDDLYRRILHPDEYSLLETLGLDHNEAQILLWSLKEAVLKGLRTGFRRSAQTVRLDDLSDGKGHAHMDDGPSWNLRYTRREDFWITLAFLD
ncbi:MAG: 4'-phosphopantetheinyl transferase superfamily protein [Bacteroidetes bacterium]|nr:4'-phosphopantetheinyl transferase superfamily protein [Bacteroidota bacterium]